MDAKSLTEIPFLCPVRTFSLNDLICLLYLMACTLFVS